MRCETHIVHFYHEMHFYGFEGQTKRFQTANPKHAELWVRALKKNKEKKKKKRKKIPTCGTLFENTLLIFSLTLGQNDIQAIN